MKELEKHLTPKEVKEISQDQQIYKLDLDERITPFNNHTLFKVDLKSGEILEASYSSDLIWDIKRRRFIPQNPTLIKEKGYTYVSALNKSNVEKKLSKKSNGSRINWTTEKAKI